jgi:hypothetical protein
MIDAFGGGLGLDTLGQGIANTAQNSTDNAQGEEEGIWTCTVNRTAPFLEGAVNIASMD